MKSEESVQLKPAKFKSHSFCKTYSSPYEESQLWEWLNDPKTFTESQLWPFRVEFLKSTEQQHEFETGVLNTHHGPLLSLAGKIGEVTEHYRDLKYFYGSYVLSFRFIRPYRLEFWSEDKGEERLVTVKISSYVSPSFYKLWDWSQLFFWSRFGNWMNRSVKKRIKK